LFSVAHEMGHLLLGHKLPSEAELDASGEAFYSPRQEREANVFAAEHNMPEQWVRPYCEAPPIGLDAVRAITGAFPATIVAGAVRYVELSSAACAVAYTERGVVQWATCSRRFPARIRTQIKVGRESVACDYHERGILDPSVREVPARAWLGVAARVDEDARLFEHAEVIPEPGWSGVLSLVWMPHVGRDEMRA
jgi:Zn-dependent peptidase ImmA (M78 family)